MSKKLMLFIHTLLIASISFAQALQPKPRILYGAITADSLTIAPFDKWYSAGFDAYTPDAKTVDQLKKLSFKDYTIQAFLGTWCGDTKREFPRFMKLAAVIGLPRHKIKLIAVGDGDSLYKQSPQHEEQGLGIYRVPTIIIYKKGVEIGRINEFPVNSFERDLLAIMNGQTYIPNYPSFANIKKWLQDGTLLDENISGKSLAGQLKLLVSNEHELNSLGYLLLHHNRNKEALKIFEANYHLYPQSPNIISSLGEGYLKNGNNKVAVSFLERALELNKDPAAFKELLNLLYEAKGLK